MVANHGPSGLAGSIPAEGVIFKKSSDNNFNGKNKNAKKNNNNIRRPS